MSVEGGSGSGDPSPIQDTQGSSGSQLPSVTASLPQMRFPQPQAVVLQCSSPPMCLTWCPLLPGTWWDVPFESPNDGFLEINKAMFYTHLALCSLLLYSHPQLPEGRESSPPKIGRDLARGELGWGRG